MIILDFREIFNIINLNDWKFRRFLIIALSVQFAFLGLQIFNFHIPFLKQIITFIYIIFIPGIALLKILRIHKLGYIETILYSVGLSIASLMFIGFFMNTIYPLIGMHKPISINYLIITLSLFISILFIILIRDKDSQKYKNYKDEDNDKENIQISLTPSMLLIIILLLLIFSFSILGTYLANYYQDNFVLMVLIILIAITVIVITTMNKSQIIYPVAIYIMSLSLLYHDSLISLYITGWDIQIEYYLSNLVLTNSLWNPNIISNVNAMLSIVMLAPILSILLDMNLILIYKIIYPILFSLVPIGLFIVFKKLTNDKVAFLSCFYFISILTYYAGMISLARQQIAELFLILIMVAMFDENLNRMKKAIIYIIFGFSLAVSHYGLSYLFLFSLIIIYLMLFRNVDQIVTSKFVLLYLVYALTWYVFVAGGSAIFTIVTIGSHIKDSIFEILNPQTVEGLNIMVRNELSPMRDITKYLNIITQIFIVIGIFIMTIYNLYGTAKFKFQFKFEFPKKYMNFSYMNLIILILGVAVPFVASSLNTTRLYQIALIFLAPFSIIGGLALLNYAKINIKNSLIMLSVFFSVFLLFNTGFIYEINNEPASSISLNYSADFPRYSESEVFAAHWIKEIIKEKEVDRNGSTVYSDTYRDLLLLSMTGERNYLVGDEEITTQPPPKSYIFLGKENIKNGKIALLSREYKRNNIDLKNSTFYKKILKMNKIYETGDAQILLT